MRVTCPVCKEVWDWSGHNIPLPSGRVYKPKPTKLGRCTCYSCEIQPVPKHLPPNAGIEVDGGNPWQENAIKILEGCGA